MKKQLKKVLKLKEFAINSYIYHTYYNEKINEELVYLESRDGKDFTGNILRIVEELSSGNYGNLKIVVYAKKEVHQKIKELQKNYSLKINRIISKESTATKILEKAKYIISDSSIRHKYVKRPGQIVLNTWHGTPLKLMGKYNESEEHRLGVIQQVYYECDYLLYPNDYMKDIMIDSYMIKDLYNGKILLEGYPRNSIFFEKERRGELKEKLGFKNKEVFAYMPTYKGIISNRKDEIQKDKIEEYLNEIDNNLKDNQCLLVKLHIFNQQRIDFSKFKHVKTFPKGYEPYDILNICDCLITDYSSVMFDYINSKRKIILFNYDEEEYMKDRGTYFPLSDLPFPKVQNVSSLIKELNTPKCYDDKEILEKFCQYDRPKAVKYLCKHIFNKENICKEEKLKHEKENILIFAGRLGDNGLTSSLINILNNVDKTKYNYFICYQTWNEYIKKNHQTIFKMIPEDIQFAPLRTSIILTLKEKLVLNKFINGSLEGELPKIIKRIFKRELKRLYFNTEFRRVLHFNGYGINETLLFNELDINKSIWVHSDMVRELKTKDNQNYPTLKEAYNNFDNVVVVSKNLIKPTYKISGRKDNIKVVHNVNNYETIKNKSQKEIVLDENTEILCPNPKGIKEFLKGPEKKFITIGRFSHEKGHKRLLKSFDKFCENYPGTKLIIIGGNGNLYEETLEFINTLKYKNNICTIKWISNPMPILKECDLFILSSFYEGWGMVIMEADTLNIPVISTDIEGVQWMKDYGGYLVDNSEEGILQGMYDFMDGKVSTLKIDYKKYNEQAIKEFEELIEYD